MQDILADLNPAQQQAVTADPGPVLVVAGAGSGKTRVLTTRVAWLLEKLGVHPGEILAFTFTNRAAREMRERVAAGVGSEHAPFWIGTFHATGLKILRQDGAHIGIPSGFSIFDTDDSKRLVKETITEANLDAKQFVPNAARAQISNWKNEDISPQQAHDQARSFVDQKFAELYRLYEEGLVRCRALDFDDLILRTVHLFEQVEDVRLKYAQRFRHVLVDEFQDTNALQMVLVKLLTSSHGSLFVVGDDDQSIYSWRGARIENMLEFEDYFPGAVTLRLEQNYRSCGNILAAANEVITHNRRRKGKNLWTDGPAGDLLVEENFLDAEDEAARLVDIVNAEADQGLGRGDVTVLYRTNAQSRVLEDALRRASIPYQIVGSVHFYERKEVRDMLAYLKLVGNPADTVSLQRVINVPRRQIGTTSVKRLLDIASRESLTPGEAAARPDLLEFQLGAAACKRIRAFLDQAARWRLQAAEGVPVHRILQGVLQDTGYLGHLDTDDPITAGTRSENVAELVNAAGSFDESTPGGTLAQFLEQVALVADPDTIVDGEGVVRLMTIHTAKGLEFPVVVVAGCEDDILPHINSADQEHTLEEERRLFYVALTRAQKRVYLLHAARRRRFGTWQDSLPSRFLAEIPAHLIQRRHLDQPASQAGLFSAKPGPVSHARRSRRQPARWTEQVKKVSQAAHGDSHQVGWGSEVNQEIPFYAGQSVSHGIFGAGVVARIEGSGPDMLITVDFQEVGRKHINPRFAPLLPVD